MADQPINSDGDIIKEVQADNWTQGVCVTPWQGTYTEEFTEEFT